jgi:hypothetical protein
MPVNPFMIAIVAIAGATLMTIFGPIAKAYAKRISNERPASARGDGELEARLERMENAIESIAVEIERVSEGQRFTTRLLSDQRGGAAPGGEKP